MAFKPFKLIGKIASKLIPFGGIVSDIISPEKTQEEKDEGLKMLTPIAQYNRTMARPRIAIMITATFLLGNIIQWIQVLCKVQKAYQIEISGELTNFTTIVVTAIVTGRGIQKIVEVAKSVIKKRKKK